MAQTTDQRIALGGRDLRGWEWRYLWQQCQSDALALLTQRPARGMSVSFSPDGTRLAAGYLDGRVELWDPHRRSLLEVLQERGPAAHVRFAPTGMVLAATSAGGLKLHNLDTGQSKPFSLPFRTPAREIAFSPDQQLMSTFTRMGNQVFLWDLAAEKLLYVFPAAGATLHMGVTRISPDKERLYYSFTQSIQQNPQVRCREIGTGKELWETVVGKDYGVSAMALSPDGKWLAAGIGYSVSTIFIIETASGKIATKLDGHTAWVCSVDFSRDGTLLASAAADQTLRVWDAGNWSEKFVLRGHGDEVHAVAFSPDGRLLASGAKDGTIMLWDLALRQAAANYFNLGQEVTSARLAGGARVVASLAGNESLARIDLQNPSLRPLNIPEVQSSDRLLTLRDGVMLIAQERQVKVLKFEGTRITTLAAFATTDRPAAGAFCPAKNWAAVAYTNGLVKVLSIDEGKTVAEWNGGTDPSYMWFSPSGRYLGVQVEAKPVEVWERPGAKLVLRGEARLHRGDAAGFNPTETLLLTVESRPSGNEVAIYSLTNNESSTALRRFPEKGAVVSLAITPDGKSASACSQDGLIMTYDLQRLKRRSVWHAHMQGVHEVSYSPDGSRIISSSGAREAIKIWDAVTEQELLTLPGTGSLLDSIDLSNEGILLAGSWQSRGTWQVWRAPPWEEIERIEQSGGGWPRSEQEP